MLLAIATVTETRTFRLKLGSYISNASSPSMALSPHSRSLAPSLFFESIHTRIKTNHKASLHPRFNMLSIAQALFLLPLVLGLPITNDGPLEARDPAAQLPDLPFALPIGKLPSLPMNLPTEKIPTLPTNLPTNKIPAFLTNLPTGKLPFPTDKIPAAPTGTGLPKIPDLPTGTPSIPTIPTIPGGAKAARDLPVKTGDLSLLVSRLLGGKKSPEGISIRSASPQLGGGLPLVGGLPIIGGLLGGLGGGNKRREAQQQGGGLPSVPELAGGIVKDLPLVGGLAGGLKEKRDAKADANAQLSGVGPVPLGVLGSVPDTLKTLSGTLGGVGGIKRDEES